MNIFGMGVGVFLYLCAKIMHKKQVQRTSGTRQAMSEGEPEGEASGTVAKMNSGQRRPER